MHTSVCLALWWKLGAALESLGLALEWAPASKLCVCSLMAGRPKCLVFWCSVDLWRWSMAGGLSAAAVPWRAGERAVGERAAGDLSGELSAALGGARARRDAAWLGWSSRAPAVGAAVGATRERGLGAFELEGPSEWLVRGWSECECWEKSWP